MTPRDLRRAASLQVAALLVGLGVILAVAPPGARWWPLAVWTVIAVLSAVLVVKLLDLAGRLEDLPDEDER
ncbi:hypothetical protein LO762_27655 [Actinocorallia sp. API 0066]|uniref:hypothetical protein n=1 Tax=Actinocorallia sp. API 0066 TaxID=2896846 RepID=UPI001E2BFBD5|nr:hypothetical protein [Actinocorallia sp. API 0066]MCD0452927.1 hypothetical protein [Actinocorallia sp. API 0066]